MTTLTQLEELRSATQSKYQDYMNSMIDTFFMDEYEEFVEMFTDITEEEIDTVMQATVANFKY